MKLSGIVLHRNPLVATAADSAGVQYIGQKKDGVVRQLPVA